MSNSNNAQMLALNNRVSNFVKSVRNTKFLIIMVLPALIHYIIFKYVPMWGVIISFMDFSPWKGFFHSPWVGFEHFSFFFRNPFCYRIIRNTLLLNVYSVLWGFPMPIMLALILNEVRNLRFKKFVQTVSYMPHFISTVVVVSLFYMFLSPSTGPINNIIASLGFEKVSFFSDHRWFRTIYISSSIWANIGWGAIIYLAALTNIDPGLYEAATIDGANKFQKLLYVTLPCLAPTIIILLLLRLGHLMSVGFEKAFLMQTPTNREASEVISTYVYGQGLGRSKFSYASAVGLFDSVLNLIILFLFNTIARKVSETSLW